MNDAHERVAKLRQEASGLPYGSTKVALLEEAAQVADSSEEIELAYGVRYDLLRAAVFSGQPDVFLVAFSWRLAQFDRDPGRFNRHELLWTYKWVVGNAVVFPEISRPRLEMLLADMERRHREDGSTLHAVAQYRRGLLQHFGERQLAQAAHTEFLARRRDALSDCRACVANTDARYYAFQRQWSESVQAAQEVLEGRLQCVEEPHKSLNCVLILLLRLGRVDEAKAYQRQGYRLVSRGKQFIVQHAEQLQFLALTGNTSMAKKVFEDHLAGALETVDVESRFRFLLAARLWTERLLRDGKRTLKLRLPKGPPEPDSGGKSDLNVLGAWLAAETQAIARRFDSRNGTDAFQEQIDELPDLLALATS